jgi:alkaline phosphatase D
MGPDLRYAETSKRGYIVLTLKPNEARSDWIQVSTVFSHSFSAETVLSLKTVPGNHTIVPV